MDREPATIVGAIVGAVEALIVVVVQLGIEVDAGLRTAIVGAVVAIGAAVQAWQTRRRVYSPRTVRRMALVAEARNRGALR